MFSSSLQSLTHTLLLQVMNVESDSILMRRMDFFHRYDIEVWLRKEVSTSCVTACAHRQSYLEVSFHTGSPVAVFRLFPWTRTRRQSHLMMVQSRAMTRSSSQLAAGTNGDRSVCTSISCESRCSLNPSVVPGRHYFIPQVYKVAQRELSTLYFAVLYEFLLCLDPLFVIGCYFLPYFGSVFGSCALAVLPSCFTSFPGVYILFVSRCPLCLSGRCALFSLSVF